MAFQWRQAIAGTFMYNTNTCCKNNSNNTLSLSTMNSNVASQCCYFSQKKRAYNCYCFAYLGSIIPYVDVIALMRLQLAYVSIVGNSGID